MIRTVAATATAATTANRFTTEPLPVHTVGLGGLEPPTSSLSAKRSNHLSYRPVTCTRPRSEITASVVRHPNSFGVTSGSVPICQRHLDAADDVGGQVVDERTDGRHRRQQHDIHQTDEQRAAEN